MEMVDTWVSNQGGDPVTEPQLLRMAKRRLAILRHAEEITGNVALTCRFIYEARGRRVNVAARSAFLGSWPDPCSFPGDKLLWFDCGEA